MNSQSDIRALLQLYIDRKADKEQRRLVREYIMDDASRFEMLIDMMRRKTMIELDMDPADDFLPEHVQNCIGETDANLSAGFMCYNAVMPEKSRKEMFDILKEHFLETEQS